jgi:L-2-hydroxyglutarate oxidase LhgO
MAESINTLVIGAGVVGLAVARTLAHSGREVVLVDRNGNIGEETSSRNSEVIHAGIYYATGSLKAQFCTAGKHALYEYCRTRHIPHRRIGKLIVAVDPEQRGHLESLQRQALANGVDDLEPLDAAMLREAEPAVRGVAALRSPSTGIIDNHALMTTLRGDAEDDGCQLALRTTFDAMLAEQIDGARLRLVSDGVETELVAREIINAAGLAAVDVARRLESESELPVAGFAKGNYFLYRGDHPFRHLIYPLPVAGGLGVHVTLDLAGKLRFGPDVEWIDTIDYSVSMSRRGGFADAIRAYWPGVDPTRLEPGYAGVRPKLLRDGTPSSDFEIRVDQRRHARMVHLLGIESPGLTACLAIADHVRSLLD